MAQEIKARRAYFATTGLMYPTVKLDKDGKVALDKDGAIMIERRNHVLPGEEVAASSIASGDLEAFIKDGSIEARLVEVA